MEQEPVPNGTYREKALHEARSDQSSTKARILKAAEEIFARKGFKGTTTRDIVNAADVNIALLHYHWGSKEELWNAVYQNLMSLFYEELQVIIYEVSDKEPREAIRILIAGMFDFLADNPNVPMLMQHPKHGMDRPWTVDVGVPAFNAFLEYLETHAGLDFDPVATRLAVYLCIGAFEFLFIRQDLVKAYFGEDAANYSGEFRERAIQGICTMIERFGRLE